MWKEMEIRLPWSVFLHPWLHHCGLYTGLVTSLWSAYTPGYVIMDSVHPELCHGQ